MLKINVQDKQISLMQVGHEIYVSMTDIVKGEDGSDHIKNWMRNRNTVEFLGLWETINNENFKGVEFDTFRKEAGLNSFTLTICLLFLVLGCVFVPSSDIIVLHSRLTPRSYQ